MKSLVAVEDDPNMVLLIQLALSSDSRFQVEGGAPSADLGEELVRRVQPDLIILDHFIDGPTTGLVAAPALKRAAPNAKILLFTSHDLQLEASREPAIDAYLNKHDLADLLERAVHLLGLSSAA
jgi:DNA-binding NarL/FixJ family response regulator